MLVSGRVYINNHWVLMVADLGDEIHTVDPPGNGSSISHLSENQWIFQVPVKGEGNI